MDALKNHIDEIFTNFANFLLKIGQNIVPMMEQWWWKARVLLDLKTIRWLFHQVVMQENTHKIYNSCILEWIKYLLPQINSICVASDTLHGYLLNWWERLRIWKLKSVDSGSSTSCPSHKFRKSIDLNVMNKIWQLRILWTLL